ncbi:hypothetical protein M758_1G165600 [Ceratodon purpureus]|uniref:NADH dehydrogenase subunit 1 n=1 Tax=Ceratodon purpureus TaxID=3225 RepID=A0A8T0J737_CERPU|nr:hypothetical protein KC19_1G169500 [Ceratodon purpureus]KAG0630258.1 hypothetical protein M758_1G165600 [Ceratodon purpureus]
MLCVLRLLCSCLMWLTTLPSFFPMKYHMKWPPPGICLCCWGFKIFYTGGFLI